MMVVYRFDGLVVHTVVVSRVHKDTLASAENKLVQDERISKHVKVFFSACAESTLGKTHEIVDISFAQMDPCGNALEVEDGRGLARWRCPRRLTNAFTPDQRKDDAAPSG
jgi:hypothetical protein